MANNVGLFSALDVDPRAAELEARRAQALQLAGMGPAQQIAAARLMSAANTGAAFSDAARAGLGAAFGAGVLGPRDRKRAALERVRAAMQGADPSNIDTYYPALIRALHAEGLHDEARAMLDEYETLRGRAQDRATRAVRAEADTKKAEATAAFARARMDALLTSPKERILEAYSELESKLQDESLTPAERKTLEAARNAHIMALGGKPSMENGKWVVRVQQGSKTDPARVIAFDPATGKTKITTLDGRPISETDGGDKKKKPLSDVRALELADALNHVGLLVSLSRTFKPEFSFSKGAAGLFNKIASAAGSADVVQLIRRVFGDNTPALAWWSQYAQLIANIRHDLFGASLTKGEQGAFDQIRAMSAMAPGSILSTLKTQAATGLGNVLGKLEGVRDTRDVESLYARAVDLEPRVANMPGYAPALPRDISGASAERRAPARAPAPEVPAPAAPTMAPQQQAAPRVTIRNW